MAAPKVDSMLGFVSSTIVIGIIMNHMITSTEATWCVVRSGCSSASMLSSLNWACSHGADCGPIQPGGSCFNPNTIQNHASYAFDSYYQRMGRAPGSCNFGGCATISVSDPSFAGCKYPPRESIAGKDASVNNTKLEKSVHGDTREGVHR